MMHSNQQPELQPTRRARGASRLWMLSLLGLSLLVVLEQATAIAGEVIYTGRHALKIPFDFQEAQIRALKATEVQLLVSTDRGRTWKTAARSKPQDRQFKFNAAENGEYWFAVRLVNVLKESVQPGAPQVGLKVIVDDVAPSLELKARELSAGRVELTWQAEDDALDLETLEIQYREGEEGEWKTVNAPREAAGRVDLKVKGEGTLFTAARISDLAHNTATADSQILTAKPASNTRQGRQPDFSKPVANSPSYKVAETSQPPVSPPASVTIEPENTSQTLPDAPEPLAYQEPRPAVVLPHEQPSSALPHLVPGGSNRPLPQSISYSGAAPISVLPSNHGTRPSPYPPGARVVNSTSFNIGYQVGQVGPSGVGGVDLFITEDYGRSWFHYGSDPDRTSPFAVRVEKSGQFGFAIRARSGIGLSENPPKNGDLPEIVVVVDQVAPRPRLGTIQQGQGFAHNQVQFSWVLTDADLPETPVMLLKSTDANGPWEPISGWIENTGRYIWTVNQSVEGPVYIRLEARDLAGNIGRADLDQAVQIDLVKPTARFTDVETITQ